MSEDSFMPGLVSVVICTKGRPASAAVAVESILHSDHFDLELIVVDQSDDDDTRVALDPFRADGRLRYVLSTERGKGAALNEAIRLVSSAIVICTDDDCEAPQDWVGGMAAAFNAGMDIAVVYSDVVAAETDRAEGYIPTYSVSEARILRSVMEARSGLGIGAAMAFRRQAIEELGGFDEALGPGARFMACDDWDIGLRCLLSGRAVHQTPDVAIVHHGFRGLSEGRSHNYRDWVGIGAMFGKLIKTGHPSVVVPALWTLGRFALLPPIRDLVGLRRPRGLVRLLAFVRGLTAGLSSRVDRTTLTFARAPGRS